MDAVLWVFCVLWLSVLAEGASISLTSRHLLTFPIDVGSLLGVRILSLFCSPVAQLIALGSLISLWPFFHARHTVLGGAAALLLFALALGLGMSLSVAATPSATFIPLITLLAISAAIGFLLFWSFRRSLFTQTAKRAEGRATGSVLWFPGRFGGLVRKEQYYFRKLLDLWMGLLLVVAISVASLFGSPPPIVRQSIILIVFALNVNVIMNCFGTDTAAELNRYAILPLRGKEVLLVKNLGLTVIVAAQLALLILTAAWRSGPVEAGAEIIEAAVLLLSHLAWGNLVAVAAPFKMQFYRLASGGAPLTMMAGATIGSVPGLSVIVLFRLHSESPFAAMAIAVILLLVIAAYLVSLHYAGRSFEHRRHIIGERLS